jgi:histidine ammonia-lyase
MANKLENFIIGIANMDVAVMLRIDRFSSPFFTVVKATDVLPAAAGHFSGYTPVALQQEIQGLTNPVAPFGSAIVGTVEDLQAQTLIKVQRARQAVGTTLDLLAHDLLEASLWLDVRKAQNAHREFGQAPTAAWSALRAKVPLIAYSAGSAAGSDATVAASFVRDTDPGTFYPTALPVRGAENREPASCRIPRH